MHEGELRLAVFRLLILISLGIAFRHPLCVTVAPDVHLSERTYISYPRYFHREVSVEVCDLQGFMPHEEYENDRGEEGTEQFLYQVHLYNTDGTYINYIAKWDIFTKLGTICHQSINTFYPCWGYLATRPE